MVFKKLDRARQWTGEKIGADSKTSQSDEFQTLEAEVAFRQNGIENLHKSTAAYLKWASRRCDTAEDKSRCTPTALLGRSMVAHGDEFDPESEFGTCLSHIGRTKERLADLQARYLDVTQYWQQHLDRSLVIMKEYQAARKKLESRRLAYDASLAKVQKAKRDDFRVEEEMRVCKTKFDDSSEDVYRRMQDIKDSEAENAAALSTLLDCQLTFHERATEELRRTRELLPSAGLEEAQQDEARFSRTYPNTSRRRASAFQARCGDHDDASSSYETTPSRRNAPAPPPYQQSPRQPPLRRALTSATSAQSSPRIPTLIRNVTDTAAYSHGIAREEYPSDDDSVHSDSVSPGCGERSASSTTSYDSVTRSSAAAAPFRKGPPPPPPPPMRAKKPPAAPVPARKVNLGY